MTTENCLASTKNGDTQKVSCFGTNLGDGKAELKHVYIANLYSADINMSVRHKLILLTHHSVLTTERHNKHYRRKSTGIPKILS